MIRFSYCQRRNLSPGTACMRENNTRIYFFFLRKELDLEDSIYTGEHCFCVWVTVSRVREYVPRTSNRLASLVCLFCSLNRWLRVKVHVCFPLPWPRQAVLCSRRGGGGHFQTFIVGSRLRAFHFFSDRGGGGLFSACCDEKYEDVYLHAHI